MKIIPVISDLQVPFHDRRAVDAIATMIADREYEQVVCVGDVLDQYQISQWHRGRAGEYDGQLAKQRDVAVQVMVDLGVTDLSRSNHDDRLAKYVAEHAPGLSGLPELTLEEFLWLDEQEITFHRKPMKVAPGWVMMHGDESGNNRTSGGTALGIARKAGSSVVCGHTHKLGVQHDHPTMGGRITREVWGFEVGNLMDATKADYLKAGIANWQQGFGILVVDGKDVTPVPIPIRNGRFFWDGKTWKA